METQESVLKPYSLIKKVLSDPYDSTKIRLLYASTSEDDILLFKELQQISSNYPRRLKVWYTIDKMSNPATPWPYSIGYITTALLDFLPPSRETSATLICGPPPMVGAVKRNLQKSDITFDIIAL